MARELQRGQLQMWQTTGKSPHDAFELLQLDNKDVHKLMVETLTTRYTDQGDQGLAQLLLRSKNKHGDLTSIQRATALEATQLRLWLDKGGTPETATRWLAPEGEWLEEAEETLLKTYREDYDIEYGRKKTVET
ncbi:hypothetical protein PsorP6_015625 [Peronosclerospora sorghi]|uniref:Uncharacterized protein n=1 Tax=Peronosclerospora sorghi TaxID=230839 RepID=A0ACC0WR98_9STRA|nr:hypothetical protein PsorP6_015625 [Peronosclerospora sorghi]